MFAHLLRHEADSKLNLPKDRAPCPLTGKTFLPDAASQAQLGRLGGAGLGVHRCVNVSTHWSWRCSLIRSGIGAASVLQFDSVQ